MLSFVLHSLCVCVSTISVSLGYCFSHGCSKHWSAVNRTLEWTERTIVGNNTDRSTGKHSLYNNVLSPQVLH